MINKIYYRAALAARKIYDNSLSWGYGVEAKLFYFDDYTVLAFAGTNGRWDWLANIDPRSKYGMKRASVKAAERVGCPHRYPNLIVTGHSQGAARALVWHKLYKADHCVAFAPPPMVLHGADDKWENTTIFIDPDDPVSKAGRLRFRHPECEIFLADDDHILPSVGDHNMDNWVEFTRRYHEPARP